MIKQRGFGIMEVIILALIAGVGAGIVYTYTNAIERAQKAESDNTSLREANSEFATENQNLRILKQRQDLILAERQGKRNATAEIERRVDATLSKAMQQPEVRKWSDTPVPAAIIDSVRGEPDRTLRKDGTVPASSQPTRPAASP